MTGAPALRWQEQDIPADGLRLHIRRVAGAGKPLLLLHGLGVSGAIWQAFARRLAPPWAPIAVDLRGHGGSEHAAGGPGAYRPADYAADLVAVMDALQIARAPVVGHSLGALVGLALAINNPGRVSALVLLDPPLDPQRRNADVADVYRLRHTAPGELEAYLAQGSSSPLAARALAPVFRRADDAAFQAHLDEPPGVPWAWASAPQITVPVLLVQADPTEDGVLGDAAAEQFLALMPDARRLHIPGARHAIHASHPAEVAGAVLEFLTIAER
ncbi:MAG: alpha/beta hydrolase [Chloroflexota bacterium]|nr:alpha/beta hydrolase [Chloroflexota bacterium]